MIPDELLKKLAEGCPPPSVSKYDFEEVIILMASELIAMREKEKWLRGL